MPIEPALATVDSQVLLVKNGAGEVYWPALGVNQIGDMQAGEGYQVYMDTPGTLIYPAN